MSQTTSDLVEKTEDISQNDRFLFPLYGDDNYKNMK
jgi:hypothetical protein